MSSNSSIFPNEILKKILYYCDIETVENARKINDSWNYLIQSLFPAISYWQQMCETYMSPSDLYTYRKDFFDGSEPQSLTEQIWMDVYHSWVSWSSVANVEISHRVLDTDKDVCGEIYCTKIIDDYLLVGTNVGLVYQFDIASGRLVSRTDHCQAPILYIHAMDKKTTKDLKFKSSYVFLQLTNQVYMYQVEDERLHQSNHLSPIRLKEAEFFCTQEDRFAYIDIYRNLRVGLFRNRDNLLALDTLWVKSIGTKTIFGISMLNNDVTVTFIDKMIVYKFKDLRAIGRDFDRVLPTSVTDSDLMRWSKMLLLKVQRLKYGPLTNAIGNFTFYNGIFVSFSYGQIHFRNLVKKTPTKKFDFDLDYGIPTHIYLHGRLLIIGCECGKVYFYCVRNWQNFDLLDYDRLECLSGESWDESIAHLTVSELRGRHRVVVTTTMSIRFFEIDVPK